MTQTYQNQLGIESFTYGAPTKGSLGTVMAKSFEYYVITRPVVQLTAKTPKSISHRES